MAKEKWRELEHHDPLEIDPTTLKDDNILRILKEWAKADSYGKDPARIRLWTSCLRREARRRGLDLGT